ncbi:MAG: type II secretion system GspH family protein [Desulfobacterota bacterium]|nr:type II secretion system GspH family protein [Thermodesulfobacteriota bacterium]MDW8002215.1 type II secretion system protein [Deltaproteobacteria bacterium]
MRKNGFSLLEILAVIAIIGILASLSAVSFRDLVLRYSIEGQIKELYSDLMNLRLNAMHRNRTCFLVISTYAYRGYEDSHPSPFGDDALDLSRDNLILPEKKVKFPFTYGTGDRILFDSRGYSDTNRTICVFSNVNPGYDCLKISRTRISMGKIKDRTRACTSDNCEEKE